MRVHPDLALDLGTTTTLVYVPTHGIVLCEPSLVTVDSHTGEVRGVGIEAKRQLGREVGSMTAVRPVSNGVITDFDLTVEMLRRFVRTAFRPRRPHPGTVMVGVPTGATFVERRAVEEACLSAGARDVSLVEEPMAAAVGAGIPVTEAAGSLVVDIGGGITEVALIALGEIVVSHSVRTGGEELDEAIVRHVSRERELLVGRQGAEEVKLEIGSAFPAGEDARMDVPGFDAGSALPRTAVLASEEIRVALERPVVRIIDAVKETLGAAPPEFASDLMERGMILTGGGSLLRGLTVRLREETQMPTHLAEWPVTCVAAGAGAWLEASRDQHFEKAHTRAENGSVAQPDRRPVGPRQRPAAMRPLDASTPCQPADALAVAGTLPVRASEREMMGMAGFDDEGNLGSQASSAAIVAGQEGAAAGVRRESREDRPVRPLGGRRKLQAATPGRLLDDVRNIKFPPALRGYERSAVDRYVQRVNHLVAELEISSSPQAAVRHALAEASEEAGDIVRRAHQTAEEVIARSAAEAAEALRQAGRQAEETLEAAQAEATETHQAAQSEAREHTDMIAGEAQTLLDTARDEAAELRETTLRHIAHLREATVHENQQLRAAAQSEADQIRADARRRSEQMLVRAETRSRDLARDAEATWREYRRLMEDARMVGEQLVAIGERRDVAHLPDALVLMDVHRQERTAPVSEPAPSGEEPSGEP